MGEIQGTTPNEKFASIESLIAGMQRKLLLVENNTGKKPIIPFHISGHAETCESGQILCASLFLLKAEAARVVIVIDEYPEKTDLFAVVSIKSDGGEDSARKLKIEPGVNRIEDNRKIKPGDKISISIMYPEQSPKGIWIAMRGTYS